MQRGQPPWHASRQQLARSLHTLQSTNKPSHSKENELPQPHDNAVQLLHSRIAAVKCALLAGPTHRRRDEESHNAEGSAATQHAAQTDLLCLDEATAGSTSSASAGSSGPTDAELQRIFSDALAAHDALDFAAALPLFKLAGNAGHGPSCGYVALYCIEGRAMVRDTEQAWTWACRGEQLHDAGSIGLKAR
jgi:hypothetical protein